MINRLYGYRNVTIIKTFILARYSFKDFRSCWAASSALRLGNQCIDKPFQKLHSCWDNSQAKSPGRWRWVWGSDEEDAADHGEGCRAKPDQVHSRHVFRIDLNQVDGDYYLLTSLTSYKTNWQEAATPSKQPSPKSSSLNVRQHRITTNWGEIPCPQTMPRGRDIASTPVASSRSDTGNQFWLTLVWWRC